MSAQLVKTPPFLQRLLTVLAVLIFFLIIVGGLVRNLNAGLACPDWPLCHGKIIPPFTIPVFAEYFHRVFAALVGLITVIIAIYIARHKALRSLLGQLSLLALLLLFSQIILGGLTVLQLLKSEIVTLHLTAGTLYFLVVLIMVLRIHRFGEDPRLFTIARDRKREEPSGTWRLAVAALVALFLQIILGGMVSSHYAGLACPDFPTCHGMWWPGLQGMVGIQMLHRLGALVAFCVVMAFIIKALRNPELPQSTRTKVMAVAFCLVLQIILGISNVLLQLPVALSVTHLAVAEALFALVVMCTYEIRHGQLH